MGASAMWMEQVARNWLTWEMTGSALQLGAVNFARAIPSIFAGLFAGVMADRVSKKRLLVVAQTWSFIVYVAMAWIVLSGNWPRHKTPFRRPHRSMCFDERPTRFRRGCN